VYEISRDPLKEFAPNLHGRRVSSLAQRSKVKDQGSPGTKTAFSTLSRRPACGLCLVEHL